MVQGGGECVTKESCDNVATIQIVVGMGTMIGPCFSVLMNLMLVVSCHMDCSMEKGKQPREFEQLAERDQFESVEIQIMISRRIGFPIRIIMDPMGL